MKRYVHFCSALVLLLVVPSAALFAQSDPRVRRANREKAVALTGPIARDFVETYGDEAVAAIFAVSKATAVKLAEFHASSELGKLPRPRDLLRIIANPRYRDDVALWAIQHGSELTDTDSFDAYLARPLEYAMGLRQLQTGAASVRANRLNPTPPTTDETTTPSATTKFLSKLDSATTDDRVGITAGVCLVILCAVCYWRKKRAASY